MNDVVIKAEGLTKIYKIYERDIDRLKETFHPFHKRYSRDFYALQDLNFEIRRGENVGLVGKNGAGKSTLLKIITGVLTPTSGTIQVNGRIASLLELGAGFNPDMTGVENIYMNGLLMGQSKEMMDAKVDDIIAFADIGEFINQPVKTYSSGMFARLAFSVNAFVEPDILIIDEALSVGDAFFQSKCMDRMKKMIDGGTTVLFVSHDTFAVKNLCQRAFLVQSGKIVMDATAREVIEAYRSMLATSQSETENSEKLETLIEVIRNSQELAKDAEFDVEIDKSEKNLLLGQENFLKKANYQRTQDGRVSFENVQLFNLNGDLISEVFYGQEVILRMVVKFHADIEFLGMGYHIRNLNGIDLVYTDSRFNETKAILDAKRGEIYIIDWKFKMELKEDIYDIACVISTPTKESLDYPIICDFVPCALQFSVSPANDFEKLTGGYVHWHNDLKVEKIKGCEI